MKTKIRTATLPAGLPAKFFWRWRRSSSRCWRYRRLGSAFARQFFSRYPVLKIHHTATMQMAKKPSVMPTLRPMLTSAIS